MGGKNLGRWSKDFGNLTTAIVLSFWKIVPLFYPVDTLLMRKEEVNMYFLIATFFKTYIYIIIYIYICIIKRKNWRHQKAQIIYIYVCIYMYICMYINIYMYIHIYTIYVYRCMSVFFNFWLVCSIWQLNIASEIAFPFTSIIDD